MLFASNRCHATSSWLAMPDCPKSSTGWRQGLEIQLRPNAHPLSAHCSHTLLEDMEAHHCAICQLSWVGPAESWQTHESGKTHRKRREVASSSQMSHTVSLDSIE